MKPYRYAGQAYYIARQGMLLALALCLSWLETMLPLGMFIPLPGVKLGLANVVTLAALYLLDVPGALSLTALRCLLGAALGGGWTALLLSLSGGMLSAAAMAAVRRLPILSIYGVSLLGAACHGLGQLAAACLLSASPGLLAYLPFLLLAGILTGVATAGMGAGVLHSLTHLHIKSCSPGGLSP